MGKHYELALRGRDIRYDMLSAAVCEGRTFINGLCVRCGKNHWPAEKK